MLADLFIGYFVGGFDFTWLHLHTPLGYMQEVARVYFISACVGLCDNIGINQ